MINTGRLKTWTLASLLAIACAAPQFAWAQGSFKRIVVFGTSLSDPGNAFVLYGGTNTPPDYEVNDFLVPPARAPYARGGHHFSNGLTWIEQFARRLGLAGKVRAALRSANPGATNYAVGGARAYEDGINFNLSQQVQTFLDDSGGQAASEDLYVIEMGGNDIQDAIDVFVRTLMQTGDEAQAMQAAGATLANSLQSIADQIVLLWSRGATKFLVWNAPDVSLTPAVKLAGPGAIALAQALSAGFNIGLQGDPTTAELDGVLPNLAQLPGIQLTLLDVYSKVHEIVAAPAGFGLTNVNTACITRVAPFHCQNFDEYLFWDGIHPTTAAHAIIAQFAAATLAQ
jgi:phospholipase/lecithinase/hemolysin